MPTSYWIDLEREVVVSRVWGVLTDSEIREHHARLATDPAFTPGFRHLTDVRHVEGIDARSDEWSATTTWRFLGAQRRAILTATDEQGEAARLFARYAELVGGIVAVFRSWTAAVTWLDARGLEPAD